MRGDFFTDLAVYGQVYQLQRLRLKFFRDIRIKEKRDNRCKDGFKGICSLVSLFPQTFYGVEDVQYYMGKSNSLLYFDLKWD